jgi:hypothetical protein
VIASLSGRFTPRERALVTHWTGGRVGLRAGLDAVVRRKIPIPYRDLNTRSSSPKPSTTPLSYPGSLVQNIFTVYVCQNTSNNLMVKIWKTESDI